MFTWHICYTSNSASSQFTVQSMITLKIRRPTPRYYRNESPRCHGITMHLVPIPAVLLWTLFSLPRSNRGYRGKSPSPCSSPARIAYVARNAGLCYTYPTFRGLCVCLCVGHTDDLRKSDWTDRAPRSPIERQEALFSSTKLASYCLFTRGTLTFAYILFYSIYYLKKT